MRIRGWEAPVGSSTIEEADAAKMTGWPAPLESHLDDMTPIDRETLIYDWNQPDLRAAGRIQFDDETLRDGLQSPSVKDPTLDQKIELVHLMDTLGIHTANVGLPGAGARAREHIQALAREMKSLSIRPNVACRTVVSDL